MHGVSGEVHDHTFPYPACRRRRVVPGGCEHAVEWLALEIDRHKADNSNRSRQLRDSGAFVFLRSRMINLEHFYAGKLTYAPGAPVIAGAKNDELRHAGSNRRTHG